MTPPLRGAQRRYLRAQANHLQPAVIIGKQGLVEPVLAAIEAALASQELIKVRFQDHKEARKELAAQIADATRSHLAGQIGFVAILYRPHADPKERRIQLPRAQDEDG